MTTVNATAAAAATARTSGLTSAASQEDRFMKLLVAQLKNQDPLNPMDNAQMTSQVAQINTVGGIEKLNKTVESLVGAFGQMQAQNATQLPGRNVLVEGNRLDLAGGKAAAGIELDGAASSAQVEIVDTAGVVVRRIDFGAVPQGVRHFTWDGLKSDGTAAADGAYTMRLKALNAGDAVAGRTLSSARVQAVSSAEGGTLLDLGSLGQQAWSAIKSFF